MFRNSEALARQHGLEPEVARRYIAFERFASRLQPDILGFNWLIKGGYALSRWLGPTVRPTADLDLSLPNAGRLEYCMTPRLQLLIQDARPDGFSFAFAGEPERLAPDAYADGAAYGRHRHSVTCSMEGKPFSSFDVDVDFGDKLVEPPAKLPAFASGELLTIPVAAQWAEKIHACTMRETKDHAFLARHAADARALFVLGLPGVDAAAKAVYNTFTLRRQQTVPASLPEWLIDSTSMDSYWATLLSTLEGLKRDDWNLRAEQLKVCNSVPWSADPEMMRRYFYSDSGLP